MMTLKCLGLCRHSYQLYLRLLKTTHLYVLPWPDLCNGRTQITDRTKTLPRYREIRSLGRLILASVKHRSISLHISMCTSCNKTGWERSRFVRLCRPEVN